jgi:hypothetical protein
MATSADGSSIAGSSSGDGQAAAAAAAAASAGDGFSQKTKELLALLNR